MLYHQLINLVPVAQAVLPERGLEQALLELALARGLVLSALEPVLALEQVSEQALLEPEQDLQSESDSLPELARV